MAAPLGSINQRQLELVQAALIEKIGQDIFLNVEIVPLKRLTVPNKS